MDNEIETTSIWNKKQTDLTVGDSLKIGIVATAICAVTPMLVLGAIGGAGRLYNKFKTRKTVLELVETPEEEV
jgi:hypothetical protein